MAQILRTYGDVVVPGLVLVVIVAGGQLVRLRSSGVGLVRASAQTIAVSNLVGSAVITLVPGRGSFGRSLNLVPFAEVYSVWATRGFYSAPRDEVLINLCLFVPFAFAAGFAWPRLRPLGATVLAVAGVAASIETLQFVLPIGRAASVTDVLLPVLGAVAAWGLAAVVRSVGLHAARQPQAPLGALVEGRVAEADDVRGRR